MKRALLLYLLLALVFTYPLVFCWPTHLLGDQELPAFMWRAWWMEVVAHQGQGWSAPLLAGHFPEAGNMLDSALGLQLRHWFGLAGGHNLECLLVLLFNALGGWMLGYGVTGNRVAALLAGAVVAFNPYVGEMLNIGRVREAILGFEALAALLLWRVLLASMELSWRDGVALGWCCALAAGFYWFYGHFLLLAAVLFCWFGRANWRQRLPIAVLGLGTALLLVLPFAVPYVLQYRSGDMQREMVSYAAVPPLSVLNQVPSPNDTDYLLNSLRRLLVESRPAEYLWEFERADGLPLVVLVLASLALPLAWQRARPWLLGAALFYALSLGPYLRFHDRWPAGGWALPPYALLFRWLPFFSRLYAPNRAESMLIICLAVLAAIALAALLERVGAAWWDAGLALTLALFGLLFPMWVVRQLPLRFSVASAPAVYARLAAMEGEGAVLELPTNSNSDDMNYYQTLHQRPLVGGWAMPPPLPLPPRWKAVAHCGERMLEPAHRLEQSLSSGGRSDAPVRELRDGGVRFLVLHERYFLRWNPDGGSSQYRQAAASLDAALGAPLAIDHEARPEAARFLPPGFADAAPQAEMRVYDLSSVPGASIHGQ